MDFINSLAKSTKGHDAGTIYIILECKNQKAYLYNGKTKPLSKPKLKNIKHVELLDDTELIKASKEYSDARQKISAPSNMKDEDIRRVIKLYKKSQEI